MLTLLFVGCEPERSLVESGGFAVEPVELWSAAPGFTFDRADIVADLDGDSLADAVVTVCDSDATCDHLVVYSPLRQEVTMPGDEVATLPPGVGGVDVSGDATGDGVADLRVVGGDSYLLFEGPIVGDLGSGLPSSGVFLDVNEDGLFDLLTYGGRPLEIRFGPMSRWDGDADVVLDPSCATDQSYWKYSPPSLWPDFMGDGSPKLLWAATDTVGCEGWWLNPPAPGLYDPVHDLDTIPVSYGFLPFPDQTGDDIAEIVFDLPYVDPNEISAGPLVLADGYGAGSGFVATLPVGFSQMLPIPFDLNGDGIGEFLVRDLPPGFTALVYGGADGLLHAGEAGSWSGRAERAFLEDGVVSIWMERGDQAAIIDLGPGTVLP